MIHPAFEAFILQHEDTFLTPADRLAVLVDTHNIDHAKLLLSHMTYSRVPVVTETNRFVGTIGLTEIIRYQVQEGLSDDQLNVDIAPLVRKEVAVLQEEYELTEVMRHLVEESFLPVVGPNQEFRGIVTRKSILKAINALLHDFSTEKRSG